MLVDVSLSRSGDVNTRNWLGEGYLLTTLCGAPGFDEFRSLNMRSAKGPIQKNLQIAPNTGIEQLTK